MDRKHFVLKTQRQKALQIQIEIAAFEKVSLQSHEDAETAEVLISFDVVPDGDGEIGIAVPFHGRLHTQQADVPHFDLLDLQPVPLQTSRPIVLLRSRPA